ncbi:MAG: ProQ/FinO family protein [Gammaproteobacteria bacterium]|nr:ProQ/FinO family protein [Gammaproteobacteria bacterium]
MTENSNNDAESLLEPATSAEQEGAPPKEPTPPPWVDLSLRWPAIFNIYYPRPLKIGIHMDLVQAGFDPAYIKRALTGYCRSHRYRRILVEGKERIDLDGQPAGRVTAEQVSPGRAGVSQPNAPIKGKLRSPRPLPQPMPLSEDNTVKGRLELTLKINELPKAIPSQRDFTFGVDCDGTLIQVSVRPRLWNRLTQAAKDYPEWVANITGRMGAATEKGFVLLEPSIQVFERKPKDTTNESAAPTSPEPASPAVEEKVMAAAQDRGRAAVAAAAARRPKLTLSDSAGNAGGDADQPINRRRW